MSVGCLICVAEFRQFCPTSKLTIFILACTASKSTADHILIGYEGGFSVERYNVIKQLLGSMRFAQNKAERHLLWIAQKLVR
jgi:hypothetical protein